MKPQLLSHLRSGLIAIGLAAGLSAPALAGPSGFVAPPAQPVEAGSPGSDVVQVRDRRFRRWSSDRHWSRDRHWSHNRHFKRWPRRFARRHHGPSIGFSLSFPAYRYVDPYLYDPYIYSAPRRVYRSYGSSSAHVAWCHEHWRSYRAWDNTYQPYDGPRRRCRSPFG